MSRRLILSPEDIRNIRKKIMVLSPRAQRLVKGEGLSFGEVLAAGISIETARKYGIPLDHRRKTKYDFNVSLLKDVLQKFSEYQLARRKDAEKTAKKKAEGTSKEALETSIVKSEEINIDNVCDNLIAAIESAKRKKKETLLDIFKRDIATLSAKLGLSLTDDEVARLFETILNDLAVAGYGKITNKVFSRSDYWDSTMAREMILERIRRLIEERK